MQRRVALAEGKELGWKGLLAVRFANSEAWEILNTGKGITHTSSIHSLASPLILPPCNSPEKYLPSLNKLGY